MSNLHRELASISDVPSGGASASPPDGAEQRMLGAIPGEPALGRGPAPNDDYSRHEYDHPAAGCYRAVVYELARGCTAGYMPELNVLCGIADFSTQSEQPVTKHLVVEVTPARSKEADR